MRYSGNSGIFEEIRISQFAKAQNELDFVKKSYAVTHPGRLKPLAATLRALRADYVDGYMQSIVELIHAEVFADFLEMADHLVGQGYKDPAAVLAGSVLEEHLRKLCIKNGIPIDKWWSPEES